MFPLSAKIPMIRAYYMAIILLKTWWWSFPRRRHHLRLATHPCPDLLFKGCWSGSQHVLSSRERDLTGNREKTEKKHSHLPRALYDFLLTWLWTTERKNPPGIKWRGKKSFLECIAVSSLLTPCMALLHVLVPPPPPFSSESCSEVALWYALIHFRSLECCNRGFVQWAGIWITLPEPEAVCGSKTEFYFNGKEIIISQV